MLACCNLSCALPCWLFLSSESSSARLLQGTANLVEMGKRAKVKQIVLVSSVGADEPFFPLNLLWGVSHLPLKIILCSHAFQLWSRMSCVPGVPCTTARCFTCSSDVVTSVLDGLLFLVSAIQAVSHHHNAIYKSVRMFCSIGVSSKS